MYIVSGAQAGLPQGLHIQIARYRYQVFIEQLGWSLRVDDGFELDQFDRSDTIYIVTKNDDEKILGCARLLPTTRPYLLESVFPQLLNGLPLPRSPGIWELSRFAAMDISGQINSIKGQLSSSIAITLLHASIACAAERGAMRLITVSPIGVERLLRRAGVEAYRAGPPAIIDGTPITAFWIEINNHSNANDLLLE